MGVQEARGACLIAPAAHAALAGAGIASTYPHPVILPSDQWVGHGSHDIKEWRSGAQLRHVEAGEVTSVEGRDGVPFD